MTHRHKILSLLLGLLLLAVFPAVAQEDGRLNNDAPGAPVIIYCNADGYVFRDLSGQSIVFVAFSSVPRTTTEPVVLASNPQLDLFFAVGNFLQLEAPFAAGLKYIYRWNGCVPGRGTSTFEPGSAGRSLPLGSLNAGDAADAAPALPPGGAAGATANVVVNLSDLPVIGPSASVNVTGIDLRRAGYGITNFDILTLRTGAGVDYLPLALIEGGVFVNVLGRNSADTWLLVETGTGFRGWVRASGGGESADTFVIRRGNLSEISVIPESEMGAKAPATLVTSRTQAVYATASTETPVCEARAGEYVVNASNAAGDWLQVNVTCTDGTQVTAWIEEFQGALRNPSGGLLPIIDGGETRGDTLQFVEGPAFVFFLPRTLYGTPSTLGDILCEAAPNRYPIVGRTQDVTWYEISAVCLDGTPVRGWLQASDGFFQTTNDATVPVTG